MPPVQAKDLDRHPFIYLYDDEPLLNLAIALNKAEHPQEWWHVVVDLEEDGYAVCKVADLTAVLGQEGQDALNTPLRAFVGSVLTPVTVVLAVQEADMDALREQAYASPSQVAVLLEDETVRAIIPVGGTRSAGVFDTGLVAMAGKYGEIPNEALLSPRRKKKKSKKKNSAKPDEK